MSQVVLYNQNLNPRSLVIRDKSTAKIPTTKKKCQENDKVEGGDDLSDLLHQLKSVDVAGSIVIKENRYSGK